MAKPLALTSGEPAGIGPDITLKAWLHRDELELPAFYWLGDAASLDRRAKALALNVRLAEVRPEDAVGTFAQALPVVSTGQAATAQPGHPDDSSAGAAMASIRQAVADVMAGRAGAVVTNPIAKNVLYRAGFRHPGHTEYLAERTRAALPVMLLLNDQLRVALVTTHLPLADVPRAITKDRLRSTLRIVNMDLERHFSLLPPRIAVLGLNPHAGEAGHLGREELDIIEPVIRELKDEGLNLQGPIPADTAFTKRFLKTIDVIVAMYHDQGLPVIKHVGFGNAVNMTLGLPILRTSVDHGTALSLARSGKADTGSLSAALALAIELASAREPV